VLAMNDGRQVELRAARWVDGNRRHFRICGRAVCPDVRICLLRRRFTGESAGDGTRAQAPRTLTWGTALGSRKCLVSGGLPY
jgi:hypothetical protein